MTRDQINFQMLLSAITDGVIVVNPLGVVLYANDSALRIFERDDLVGRDLAIPFDFSGAAQEINLIRPSGLGWAELRAAPMTWEQQPAYAIGVHDITQRRRDEMEQRQAVAVFRNTREGLLITDAQRHIIRINPAFTAITGYTEADVLGKSPALLRSGRHDAAFYAEMWHAISQTGHWQGEIWNRRKNGEIYPELMSLNVIRDDRGEICNYVSVFADISKLRTTQSELDFLAHHDALTRLPNRLLLMSRLQHGMEMAQRNRRHLALLMIDLDRFKDVNDSFGHLAGDELLRIVAGRLTEQLREIDTVCRLGGDEFTVLLEDLGDVEDAAMIANEIIHVLSEPAKLSNGAEVRIGASVGISLITADATPELMLQQADAALYQAKAEGRGRFLYFSEAFTQAARARLEMEIRLRQALKRNELRVYYQPQVEIGSGRIVGAEALVRWQDPAHGLIPPAQFIHVAETCGLIGQIDNWVLRESCQQGRRWNDAGLPRITLSVNLSPYQFAQNNIGASIAQVLRESGFPAAQLEMELTESALMQREAENIETLNQLRALGVRLAIDDFGTGYSSLAYLKSFPLDVLKIDKRFVDDIPRHQDDMEIAATIIAMGHTLHLKVLAEGVENREQLAFLQQQGCDLYQGYLCSMPLPAAEFEALLRMQPGL